MTEYTDEIISSLSFKIIVNKVPLAFRLPCDWRPVLKLMEDDNKVPRRLCGQTQAVRVAWRIIKVWIDAQMALIDTAMVKTEEIFLPYTIMRDGRTLAEKVSEDPKFLLGKGENL